MTKDSAPPCGLYIKVSAATSFQDNLTAIRQAAFVINRSSYDRNMHIIEIAAEDTADDEFTSGLVQLVQSQGLVAILRGPVELAKKYNADGVILADAGQIDLARRELGDEKIIGLSCQLGRSEVEAALGKGFDYIIIGDHARTGHSDPELISWWAGRTEDPCVAGGDITNDDAALYVRAGAAFVDCTGYLLNHEKGVTQATSNMLYAIELAAESKTAALH